MNIALEVARLNRNIEMIVYLVRLLLMWLALLTKATAIVATKQERSCQRYYPISPLSAVL